MTREPREINEALVDKAVDYLEESEDEFAAAVGRRAVADDLQKIAESQEFLVATGNNEERKATAKTSERYRNAVKETEDAYTHESLMRAKRLRAETIIDLWRTKEASRRRGNV